MDRRRGARMCSLFYYLAVNISICVVGGEEHSMRLFERAVWGRPAAIKRVGRCAPEAELANCCLEHPRGDLGIEGQSA